MVTTRGLSDMSGTKMTLNCQNMPGILQVVIKFPTIKWGIVKKIHGNTKSGFCKLCLTEKYFILNDLRDNKLVNKKSEFVNKCREENKLLLSSVLCKGSMDYIIFSF